MSQSSLAFDVAFEIIKHVDVRDAANAACACRAMRALTESELWWKRLSHRVGEEAKLYVPETDDGRPLSGATWREECFRLWACRHRWRAPVDETDQDPDQDQDRDQEDAAARLLPPSPEVEVGSIKVCVRMRPRGVGVSRAGPSDERTAAVVLPLHQRLRLIKARRGGCDTAEAMRALMEESGRGAEASASPWADAEIPETTPDVEPATPASRSSSSSSSSDEATKENPTTSNVSDKKTDAQTALRDVTNSNAPSDGRDPAAGFGVTCGVLSADETENRVLAVAPGVGLREFAYDAVFADASTQASVYARAARPLVADFVNGFNGAMIVYGQTGSGKTHTMFGDARGDARGVVPRACEEVFAAAAAREARLGVVATFSVSYVEVYGNEILDLLKGGELAGRSRVAAHGHVLDGRAERPVTCMADVLDALAEGDAQKRRAATAMNDRSSRAHSVFTLSATQRDNATGREMASKLCLADLGGSEKLSKSRAHDGAAAAGTVPWSEYYERRKRLTEAVHINGGLLALKRCIDALHESQRARREGTAPPHVPYHDSKLTTLLSSALGGDGKTVVLVTAAQEHEHATETTQSLRFGERCASVETRARVGVNQLAGMIERLNAKIAACEARIKEVERWETTRTVRRDEIEGRDEVVLTSRLTGAEDLRRELEGMLVERDFLTGRAAAATTSAANAERNAPPEPVGEFARAPATVDEL